MSTRFLHWKAIIFPFSYSQFQPTFKGGRIKLQLREGQNIFTGYLEFFCKEDLSFFLSAHLCNNLYQYGLMVFILQLCISLFLLL